MFCFGFLFASLSESFSRGDATFFKASCILKKRKKALLIDLKMDSERI